MAKKDMLKVVAGNVEGVNQKQVDEVLNAFVEYVKEEAPKGESIRLGDIVTFKLADKKATAERKQKIGDREVTIPAKPERKEVVVKRGNGLKELEVK